MGKNIYKYDIEWSHDSLESNGPTNILVGNGNAENNEKRS